MLELKNIIFYAKDTETKEGDGNRRAIIDNISFTFEKGRFYAITGPNGSGKTTLAKLIMGINKVDEGKVLLNGQDITDIPITDRAKAGVAYSFQNPARFKGITCRDLISIAAKTNEELKIREIITRVGICSMDFLDKQVDSRLSGGEIKKIELATTIAQNPLLAIYDEPDTGIDLWTIEPMVRLLKREQSQHGTTTIVVSHNRHFLEAADVLIIIKEGRLYYTGDLNGATPILNDLSNCNYSDICEGEYNARCYR